VKSVPLPGPDEDTDWQTIVRVELVPHRDLSVEQSILVRDEYMRGEAAMAFDVRSPMAKYLIQGYRAALDPHREPAPEHLLMVFEPGLLPSSAGWNGDDKA
jgi:hypothetical protein